MVERISMDVHTRDAMAQGRMIHIGMAAAFLCAWIFEFLLGPVFLVPGVFYDRSGDALFRLAWMMTEYGVFSVFMILIWLGFPWMRALFGLYLLTEGLFNVISSMALEAYGGGRLALGVIYLVSAGALVFSVGVAKYIEFRRQRGIPWLGLVAVMAGLWMLPFAVGAADAGQAWMAYEGEKRAVDAGAEMMKKFAPNLDVSVMKAVSAKSLLDQFAQPGVADSFTGVKSDLGAFVKLDLPAAVSLGYVSLHPPAGTTVWNYSATAHYARDDVLISLEEDISQPEIVFTNVYAEELAKRGSGSKGF